MNHPREILTALSANPLRRFSQNFLTSPHWAERITQAAIDMGKNQVFLEIGPGLGALTKVLQKKTMTPIVAIECDRKLARYLDQNLPAITVIEEDFLDFDLPKFTKQFDRITVLSNLPYHAASPILFKLTEIKAKIVGLVLTFQKELAERLCAEPNTKAYGAPTVLLQQQFEIASLGVLPRTAFYPAPEVDSEVLMFQPRQSGEVNDTLLKLVKGVFCHRRKKLIRTIEKIFPDVLPEVLTGVFEKLNLNKLTRPENLSVSDFCRLSNELVKHVRL